MTTTTIPFHLNGIFRRYLLVVNDESFMDENENGEIFFYSLVIPDGRNPHWELIVYISFALLVDSDFVYECVASVPSLHTNWQSFA